MRGPTTHRQRGFSLAELLLVLLLIAAVLAIGLPAARAMRAGGRCAAGARYLAGQLQQLRAESIAQRRSRGMFFEHRGDGWIWHVVEDGNGNGLRTAELRRGVDRRLSGPHRLEQRVERVTLGFPPGGPFPRIPPSPGSIDDTDDPVKFGRSDIVSFSPLGRASSGTLYLTDNDRALYGLVLFGPAVRVRVWRYDPRTARWTL